MIRKLRRSTYNEILIRNTHKKHDIEKKSIWINKKLMKYNFTKKTQTDEKIQFSKKNLD